MFSSSSSRFSSIDSDKYEECRQVRTKTPYSKKIDDSLVDEVEHVLLLVDFCREIDRISFSMVCFLMFQYLSIGKCFKYLLFHV